MSHRFEHVFSNWIVHSAVREPSWRHVNAPVGIHVLKIGLTVQFSSVQFSLCDVNDAFEINVIAHISGCFNVSLVREREKKPYNRNFKHTDTRNYTKLKVTMIMSTKLA